jgi:Putative metallopeptidase
MNKYLNWIGGLALASLITVGGNLSGVAHKPTPAKTPATANTNQPRSNFTQTQSRGQIKVVYEKSDDPLSLELMQAYHKDQFFDKVAKVITAQINLPRDITIAIKDCGEVNAFYNRGTHEITMCNELTKKNYQTLREAGDDNETAWRTAIYSTLFTFYHESAHMLIHELNIPTTGKEEDAADQFSAYFLLSNDSSTDKSMSGPIVISAARLFEFNRQNPNQQMLMDEHSLSQQRFYNLLCILYGSAPNTYSDLMKELNYPDSRLDGCQAESEQLASSWKRLLEPYLARTDRGW